MLFPSQAQTTWAGKRSVSFVCRVLRRFWYSFGHGVRPPCGEYAVTSCEVLIRVSVVGNDVLGPRFGRVKDLLQVRREFGEQRHLPRLLSRMMLGLGAVDREAAFGPMDVAARQRQHFRRAAMTSLCNGETPLGAGRRIGMKGTELVGL